MSGTFFVTAHPDDEFAAWSIVQQTSRPIFLVMTQGEMTGACGADRGTQACKDRRVASFNDFLSDAGYGSAERMIFDNGDGNLTPFEVTVSIDAAVQRFGAPAEIVAAAYFGPNYAHGDHGSVHEGVKRWRGLDSIPRRGMTAVEFSDGSGNVADYDRFFACPGGLLNRHYGWLSWGGQAAGCWGTDPGFTPTQYWWRWNMTRATDRWSGPDRIATSVDISRHLFPYGAKTVYLATAGNWPDTVSAGPVPDGPILLIWPGNPLPSNVADEIRRLNPARIVALGGSDVVPDVRVQEAANA